MRTEENERPPRATTIMRVALPASPGVNPLKDAHAALDAAVLTAYGFSAKRDLLAQLLALNQEVAAKIERGEPVTAPGVPPGYPEPQKLVTEDCIRQPRMPIRPPATKPE